MKSELSDHVTVIQKVVSWSQSVTSSLHPCSVTLWGSKQPLYFDTVTASVMYHEPVWGDPVHSVCLKTARRRQTSHTRWKMLKEYDIMTMKIC